MNQTRRPKLIKNALFSHLVEVEKRLTEREKQRKEKLNSLGPWNINGEEVKYFDSAIRKIRLKISKGENVEIKRIK